MAAIAFFDMDKTLLSRNSAILWVRRELREGRIRWRDAARAAVWLGRYASGRGALEPALLEAIGTLEGQDEAEVRARSHAFYDEEVRPLIRAAGRAAIEAHRRAGDRLALLTSSSPYLSERICEELDLDRALCTRYEVVEGRFTGRIDGPLCYGDGKLEHARGYAEQAGVSLEDCAFYTDSMSDIAALEAVGRPVIVDPDPRLRREAERRGWPIQRW